ncbi:hypothetical protein [Egbenema bharatensis]|uniref:hypothetical protein n=1 Tax=Egbenema bharatensis TaxID=3463334 RepID=UPI003A8ABB1D
MFAFKQWLMIEQENQVRQQLYGSIIQPHRWQRGQAEEEALQVAHDRWQPQESYWLLQPTMGGLLP